VSSLRKFIKWNYSRVFNNLLKVIIRVYTQSKSDLTHEDVSSSTCIFRLISQIDSHLFFFLLWLPLSVIKSGTDTLTNSVVSKVIAHLFCTRVHGKDQDDMVLGIEYLITYKQQSNNNHVQMCKQTVFILFYLLLNYIFIPFVLLIFLQILTIVNDTQRGLGNICFR
jgi:hypothetical protein